MSIRIPLANLTTKLRQLRMLLPRRDFIVSAAFWLIISGMLVFFPGLTRAFDLGIKDLKIQFNAYKNRCANQNVLLIAIDSETLATAPHKWPWPQDYWASIIEQINNNGNPRAIIIDVYFQTPDGAVTSELEALAEAIGKTKRTGLVALYEETVSGIGRQLKFVPPHKLLRQASSFIGLSQQPIDEDGRIRSFLLTDSRIDSQHISWALLEHLKQPIAHQSFLKKENKTVALIDFASSEAGVPQISLKALLNNSASYELLQNSVIVIGATAPVLHDFHQTPTGLITGPEIICNTISTLADGNFQLICDSLPTRLIYYLLGALMALAVFSDFFSDPYRKMLIVWIASPLLLMAYSFFPLYHPPVYLTWLGYTLTSLMFFIMCRFIEIYELRQQLIEGEICGTLQKNFFPSEKLLDERGLVCYGRCIPYKDAGGDFYDYFKLANGKVFFMLGDVTGHGISASMITTVAKSIIILESEKDDFDLQNLMQQIGYTIFSMTRKRRMMSAVAGIIDMEKRKITIASAGHLPAVMKNGNCSFDIPLPSLPLGVAKKKRPVAMKEIEIPENGKLFIYSDGIIEGLNWKNQMLGYDAFNRLIEELPEQQSCEESADSVFSSLRLHTQGRSFEDDVTLLIIDFYHRKEEKNEKEN